VEGSGGRVTECTFIKEDISKRHWVFIYRGKTDNRQESPDVAYSGQQFYTVACSCKYRCKHKLANCGTWSTEGFPRVERFRTDDPNYVEQYKVTGKATREKRDL